MKLIIPTLCLVLWLGCGGSPPAPAPPVEAPPEAPADTAFALRSDAFADGQAIPARYTCEGLDLSPPLAWTPPPPGTLSLALLVRDPDAPDPAAPTRTWTHWLLLNLPPAAGVLPEQAGNESRTGVPAGALDGLNDWGRGGWGGPCPPVGRHRYQFLLFALDTLLPLRADWSREELELLGETRALAVAQVTGTYQKSAP
ncbi:MAG: YbhB/YbcL family Raf kinase inhibitor-like protein [bacterium]|jgi:hypothetical protein|nr:YbhB/YbcL family Raf kinase inhibitor-like protein [bacterium]